MAIQAVGAPSFTATTAAGAGKNAQATPGVGAKAGGSSGDSTTVVNKSTKVNADGSVTITITYADGHTEIQTIPASLAASVSSAAAASKQTAARGANLDVTA
jgi:hypothetical protein